MPLDQSFIQKHPVSDFESGTSKNPDRTIDQTRRSKSLFTRI